MKVDENDALKELAALSPEARLLLIGAIKAELFEHFAWSSVESLVRMEAGGIAASALARVIPLGAHIP